MKNSADQGGCYASINVKPEGEGDPGHMWGI